ncbi:MAG: AAA domain-containing protein [Planctomycetes bacterium]|nr:AAA domain-containing protein [Planctomycetota bacterium]
MTKRVVIGFLGTQLDAGPERAERWSKWRPSVSICQHEELLIDRFELLYEQKFERMMRMVVADIEAVSPETRVVPRLIDTGDPWDFERVYAALLDFAQAYPFEPDAEEYLVHITTGTHVAQICLFLLTESRHLPGKLIQTSPPRRRGQHNVPGEYAVIDLDLSRYDRIAQRFAREQREGLSSLKSGIDTRNSAFNALVEQIEHVAAHSAAPVLLTGPTGAGKSQMARRIFELKKRRHQLAGPFIEVNCATLRGDTAMSTLFGHKRGAFTGATADRPGLLRAANGGLLFLDEIGELGVDEQAMLLRALEERRFLPVGSDREVESSFQLIAGTNRDLSERVRDGHFREDLLARINLWTFRMPALIDRREDIEPNVRFELDRFAESAGSLVAFSREAHHHFMKFAMSNEAAWSGNFRDLNAAITRMATLASGGRITQKNVDDEIERLRAAWRPVMPTNAADAIVTEALGPDRAADLDPFDRVQLAEVLRVCQHSRSLAEAGRELFAVSRQRRRSVNDADRVRKYLLKFGLSGDGITR